VPVGAKFSAPIQTGPGAHPTSYTKDAGSFPGVKRPGHSVDHPLPSSVEVKEGVELYTGMGRITTFRSTTDHIYDGGPIIIPLCYNCLQYSVQ